MKTFCKITLILIVLSIVSCKKYSSTNEEYPFEAKVLGMNQDCGRFMIQFLSKTDQIKAIAGLTPSDGIYIAANLPLQFRVEGLNIKLNIRKADISDGLGPCTDMGPSYTWIHITAITNN